MVRAVFKALKPCLSQLQRKWQEKKNTAQCISAINSIHNCPAVCAWRNWAVSPLSFGHWKLIWHFQRRGPLVTRQECARDHTELEGRNEIQTEYLCYEDKVIWGRGRPRGDGELPAKPGSACRTQPSLAETRWDELRNLHVCVSSAKRILCWLMSDR